MWRGDIYVAQLTFQLNSHPTASMNVPSWIFSPIEPSLQMNVAPAVIWLHLHEWETPSENHPADPSQPPEPWLIIINGCFKPGSFRGAGYTAIAHQHIAYFHQSLLIPGTGLRISHFNAYDNLEISVIIFILEDETVLRDVLELATYHSSTWPIGTTAGHIEM